MKALKIRAGAALIALILLLAATAACAVLGRERPRAMSALSVQSVGEAVDPLTQYRTEREQLAQRQRAELNDILHDPDTDPTTLGLAQRQLMALQQRETDEAQIEAVLRARGFEDAVAVVNRDSVNVMVRGAALSQRETAVILDLVLRQTGVTSGNVKIIPIN